MLRRIADMIVLFVLGAVVLRTWALEGLVVPIRIVGPSMADTLRGPHFPVVCDDCAYPFACDATTVPPPQLAPCPNCGFAHKAIADVQVRSGDRLLLDKLTYSMRAPRRWELVLFRCASPRSGYCIKRVVGLPGESIQVCEGDVFVNGRRAKKDLSTLRGLALDVYDDRYRVQDGSQPARWQPLAATSRWQSTTDGFQFTPELSHREHDSPHAPDVDWLAYHHWRSRSPERGIEEGAISDDYGYNPTASRRLNDVRDILLRATIDTSGEGTLSFLLNGVSTPLVLHVEPTAGSGVLFHRGQPVARFDAVREMASGKFDVELALADRRVMLAIDDRQVLAFDFEGIAIERSVTPAETRAGIVGPREAEPATTPRPGLASQPLAIGVSGLTLRLENLQVLRDVFYTGDPVNGGCLPAEPILLGDDEWFVLGDNSPVSQDSRQGGRHAIVGRAALLARPLKFP